MSCCTSVPSFTLDNHVESDYNSKCDDFNHLFLNHLSKMISNVIVMMTTSKMDPVQMIAFLLTSSLALRLDMIGLRLDIGITFSLGIKEYGSIIA